MKKMNRIVCIALCLILALALMAGCNEKPAPTQNPGTTTQPTVAPTPDSGTNDFAKLPALTSPAAPPAGAKFAEELTFYAMACSVIDPGNSAFYTPQASWYTYNVYDALVKTTIEGDYVPMLATSWDTKDYKTFTFKLREGVTFHNGEKFTAADVVYTRDRALTAKGNRAYELWNKITSIEVVNDYEIKMTLNAVNVDFLFDISQPAGSILNKKAIEADKDHGTWIGTGPWKVQELVVNQYTKFVRNDNYWGEKPVTKRLTFKTIPEQSAQLISLENGELDSVQGLLPAYLPTIEEDDRYVTSPFVVNNTAYVCFNMLNPLMSDINFRTAVAYALKREDCVAVTRGGYAVPLQSGTFWGYATEYKNTDIDLIPYNIEKAKEYLAKSAYKGEEVEIVSATNDHIKNATVVQANLEAIGVKVKIYQTDSAGLAAYTKSGNTKYQMICYSASFTQLASSCRSIYYPGTTGNKANYSNARVTELLDKAALTIDSAEREAMYREIQEITAQDMPYIPIFNMVYEIVSQKGVGGLGIYPSLAHDWSHAYKVVG